MSDKLENRELQNTRIDYLLTAFRGVVGALPFGGLVAEAVGAVIPRQRIDRMADVVQKVSAKLEDLEANLEIIEQRFKSSEFIDILEEAMLQAGKAMSEERRQYLANMLVHGLTETNLNHERAKKLLNILQEVSDPEVIVLRFASFITGPEKTHFFKLHEDVLREPAVNMGAPVELHEQRALQDAWRRHIFQLGLTTNEQPGRGDITTLGRMLLRFITMPTSS